MSIEKTGARNNFELTADTGFLRDRLLEVPEPDGQISWEELADCVGKKVRPGGPAYSSLCSARRIVARDHGIEFVTIRGIGLQRLDDSGIAHSGEFFRRKLRRVTLKGLRVFANLRNYSELTNEDQVLYNVSASTFGVIHFMIKPKQQKRIEAAITQSQSMLPVSKTLQLFK